MQQRAEMNCIELTLLHTVPYRLHSPTPTLTWNCTCAECSQGCWPAPRSWPSSGWPARTSSRKSLRSRFEPAWSDTAARTGGIAGPPGMGRSLWRRRDVPWQPPSSAHWTLRCRWSWWSLSCWRMTGLLSHHREAMEMDRHEKEKHRENTHTIRIRLQAPCDPWHYRLQAPPVAFFRNDRANWKSILFSYPIPYSWAVDCML